MTEPELSPICASPWSVRPRPRGARETEEGVRRGTRTTVATLLGTAVVNGGGITTDSSISANLVNNCVGSTPAVPNCTG
ncbi:hypothetical protein GCM10009634_58680 [Saccharothrix xinjiangensis]